MSIDSASLMGVPGMLSRHVATLRGSRSKPDPVHILDSASDAQRTASAVCPAKSIRPSLDRLRYATRP